MNIEIYDALIAANAPEDKARAAALAASASETSSERGAKKHNDALRSEFREEMKEFRKDLKEFRDVVLEEIQGLKVRFSVLAAVVTLLGALVLRKIM